MNPSFLEMPCNYLHPTGTDVIISSVPYKVGAHRRVFKFINGEWSRSQKSAFEIETAKKDMLKANEDNNKKKRKGRNKNYNRYLSSKAS